MLFVGQDKGLPGNNHCWVPSKHGVIKVHGFWRKAYAHGVCVCVSNLEPKKYIKEKLG